MCLNGASTCLPWALANLSGAPELCIQRIATSRQPIIWLDLQVAVVAGLGTLFGITWVQSVRAGLLLAAGGEFAFVAFGALCLPSCTRYCCFARLAFAFDRIRPGDLCSHCQRDNDHLNTEKPLLVPRHVPAPRITAG